MNPLAAPFTFTQASNGVVKNEISLEGRLHDTDKTAAVPSHKEPTQDGVAGRECAKVNAGYKTAIATQKVLRIEAEPSQTQIRMSERPTLVCAESRDAEFGEDIVRSKSLQNHSQSDTEELAALRAANAALTERLRQVEDETPEEREVRKLKLKNAEIEQLKSSVEQVTAQTEVTKKKLAERQAHLRELNGQVAKLQPPVPYKIQERRKKREKTGEVREAEQGCA